MILAMLLAVQAIAAEPVTLDALTACRAIAVDAERLACFDRESARLAATPDRRPVLLTPQQEQRLARDVADPRFEPFEVELDAAYQRRDGRWVLVAPDGGRWLQADTRTLYRDPRGGQTFAVRRAPLGGYIATLDEGRGFRVQPVRD